MAPSANRQETVSKLTIWETDLTDALKEVVSFFLIFLHAEYAEVAALEMYLK